MFKGTVIWKKGASVREQANTWSRTISILNQGDVVFGSRIVTDSSDSTNPLKKWLFVDSLNGFVAMDYPNGIFGDIPQQRLIVWEIVYGEEYSDIFRVPNEGIYYRFLHAYESPLHDYKPWSKIPTPETVPVEAQGQFVPLTPEWQDFWFHLLERASGGTLNHAELLEAWASLTLNRRALTDRHSLENGFADYILQKNLNAPPMSIKCLGMGGNIVRSVGGYNVKTLNGSMPPPRIDDVWGDQTLIHWCTELTYNRLPNRTWQVGRFPQLNGRGVPYPFVSMTGIVRVNGNSVKRMKNGAVYSPYNPSTA